MPRGIWKVGQMSFALDSKDMEQVLREVGMWAAKGAIATEL